MQENQLISVNTSDAKELTSSIVEVEAYKELYEKAATQSNYSPQAFTDLLKGFMSALIQHKAFWKDILEKYVGEEDASYYKDFLKFDIYRKVIFLDMEALDNATSKD